MHVHSQGEARVKISKHFPSSEFSIQEVEQIIFLKRKVFIVKMYSMLENEKHKKFGVTKRDASCKDFSGYRYLQNWE